MAGVIVEILVCCVGGIVGGLTLGTYHFVMEQLWYHFLVLLEKKKLIRRLAPSIPPTADKYTKEDFWAVALPPMPLGAAVVFARHRYLQTYDLSVDLVGIFAFTWTLMVFHDAFFWTVHTLMHKFKALYRQIHQMHHSIGGEITVFSTAFGSALDIFFTFTPFYALLMIYFYVSPTWNPLYFVVAAWTVNNVDMMGHCGYELPVWVYAPASLGVLLTPMAQRPIHHYIHHLDPRFNRSLYFTWCDRVGGTFKQEHPKIGVH